MTKITKKFFEMTFLKTQNLVYTDVQNLPKRTSNAQKATRSFSLPRNLVTLLMDDTK